MGSDVNKLGGLAIKVDVFMIAFNRCTAQAKHHTHVLGGS